jgi:hypothetical protein
MSTLTSASAGLFGKELRHSPHATRRHITGGIQAKTGSTLVRYVPEDEHGCGDLRPVHW